MCRRLVCLLLCVTIVLALYEDQIGKFDWKLELIGRPRHVVAVPMVAAGKSAALRSGLVVATDKNVLAALDPSTGDVLWRRVFELGAAGSIGGLIVVSPQPSAAAPSGANKNNNAAPSSGDILTVVGANLLRVWTASSGVLTAESQLVFSHQLAVSSDALETHAALLDPHTLTIYHVLTGGRCVIVSVTLDDLQATASHMLHADWSSADSVSCGALSTALVCVTGTHMHVLPASGGSSAVHSHQLPNHLRSSRAPAAGAAAGAAAAPAAQRWLVEPAGEQLVAVTGGGGGVAQLARVTAADTVEWLPALSHDVVSVCTDRRHHQQQQQWHSDSAVLRVLRPVNETSLQSQPVSTDTSQLSTQSGAEPRHVPLPDQLHPATVARCFVIGAVTSASSATAGAAATKGDARAKTATASSAADPQLDLLLIGADHSVFVTQENGRLVWLREEALASVQSAQLVDLPISSSDASVEREFDQNNGGGVLWSLVHRLTSQWSQLCDSLVTSLTRLAVVLSTSGDSGGGGNSDSNSGGGSGAVLAQLTRDPFNLNKMLVLETEPGKLFGLFSSSGQIVWRHQLPAASGRLLLLALQRGTAHAPHSALLAVLCARSLTHLEPISGRLLAHQPLHYRVQQATLLHTAAAADLNFVRPLLVLDTSNMMHVYPNTAAPHVSTLSGSLFFHTVDSNSAVVRGFAINQQLHAVPLWQHNLSAAGAARVRHVASKLRHEHVHSQGVALADRSVLYKYINANLVAIVTETTDDVHKSCVSVYVTDSVTGHIVYSHVQRRMRCPCHVVHAENWLVYSSYNDKARRTELTSIELFRDSDSGNSTVFSSLDSPPVPLVYRQSFIFPTNIQAMTHTVTGLGITAKNILIALPSGSVLEMSRALLDPRRATGGATISAAHATAPVYMPELAIASQSLINYNSSVARPRHIDAWSSGLESTCLVLVHGLDLYWSRVFPSRMFDQLKDDFDSWLIGLVLAALVLSSLATRRLAQRKSLQLAWK